MSPGGGLDDWMAGLCGATQQPPVSVGRAGGGGDGNNEEISAGWPIDEKQWLYST